MKIDYTINENKISFDSLNDSEYKSALSSAKILHTIVDKFKQHYIALEINNEFYFTTYYTQKDEYSHQAEYHVKTADNAIYCCIEQERIDRED